MALSYVSEKLTYTHVYIHYVCDEAPMQCFVPEQSLYQHFIEHVIKALAVMY